MICAMLLVNAAIIKGDLALMLYPTSSEAPAVPVVVVVVGGGGGG